MRSEHLLLAGLALIAIVALARSVRVVPQQRMDVVERLGRYQRTLRPGVNFLVPFVEAVRTKGGRARAGGQVPAAAGDHLG